MNETRNTEMAAAVVDITDWLRERRDEAAEARKRLLAGADSVKAVALAFGFWHLSDFSRSYRDQFGETPSQTLERGRGR